jgi:hypothetical protein
MLSLLLVALGVGFAGALVALVLALFPQLRPGTIVFSVKMGDIFFHTPEWVRVPENPDEVLSIHQIAWDADGFRIPARRAETYPILAVGDSFTEAANVARPWPDALAEASGQPVRNLGFRGYGPVEQARILELYGAASGASTVVVGYFEGNDLSDAINADPANIRLPSEAASFEIIPTDLDAITERDERYPMQVELDGARHDIAFLEGYLWWLNGETRAYARSRNLEIVAASWRQMREAMGDGVCLVIAYFPGSPHIYVPYLAPEYYDSVMRDAQRTIAGDDRVLRQRPQPTEYAAYIARLGNQRDAVAERAAELDLPFIDLTPVLKAAAERGEMVYYTYDTHWNQRGHDLVGQAIADYLNTDPCAP